MILLLLLLLILAVLILRSPSVMVLMVIAVVYSHFFGDEGKEMEPPASETTEGAQSGASSPTLAL